MLNQASVKPSGQNRGFFYFIDYFETEENVMNCSFKKTKNERWCFIIDLFRDRELIRKSFFGESKQEASDKAIKALPWVEQALKGEYILLQR
jgi:hypothetical protein